MMQGSRVTYSVQSFRYLPPIMLAAAVIADSIVRIIPGVISDEQSALSDSFQDNLLAPPVYTRPAEYKGWRVPDVLLSGHEANIRDWELQQAIERTKLLRPDLLEGSGW